MGAPIGSATFSLVNPAAAAISPAREVFGFQPAFLVPSAGAATSCLPALRFAFSEATLDLRRMGASLSASDEGSFVGVGGPAVWLTRDLIDYPNGLCATLALVDGDPRVIALERG